MINLDPDPEIGEESLEKGDIPQKLKEYIRKQTKKTYTGFFKDIEISKGQFVTLFLLLVCFANLLVANIFLSLEVSINLQVPDQVTEQMQVQFAMPAIMIALGVILGFIFGGILLDKKRGKRYPILYYLTFISMLVSFNHIGFFRRAGDLFPNILFLGNSFISGMIFMVFLTFFIDFTTILERGRVFSYLVILLAFAIVIMVIIISAGFIFLPVLILLLSFLYFYKNREKETPYEPIKNEGSKTELNFNIIKYILILSFYCLAIGLFIPAQQISELLSGTNWSNLQTTIIIITAVIISIFTAISVGIFFDFAGRKASLSVIILAISIINFIRIFNVNIIYFDLIIMLAATLAAFMCVPLFMSDITQRENLGKVLAISFSSSITAVILGFYIESTISTFISQLYIQTRVAQPYAEYTSDIVLIGILNFASIISLFFLVNSKEAVSSKEQNWFDYLIHLYVIHESGVLLYEYTFIEETDSIESDLASGGITGLIAILQEITKEEQRLKSIDHGGKRILFWFSKTITLALVAKEELLVLRNKLRYFVQDLKDKYHIDELEFDGVDVNFWKKNIDPILEKHFKRKYFEFASDFLTFD